MSEEDVDPMEWADSLVLVGPVERADAEGLPCLYCTTAEFLLGERVRAQAHPACLDSFELWAAESRKDPT